MQRGGPAAFTTRWECRYLEKRTVVVRFSTASARPSEYSILKSWIDCLKVFSPTFPTVDDVHVIPHNLAHKNTDMRIIFGSVRECMAAVSCFKRVDFKQTKIASVKFADTSRALAVLSTRCFPTVMKQLADGNKSYERMEDGDDTNRVDDYKKQLEELKAQLRCTPPKALNQTPQPKGPMFGTESPEKTNSLLGGNSDSLFYVNGGAAARKLFVDTANIGGATGDATAKQMSGILGVESSFSTNNPFVLLSGAAAGDAGIQVGGGLAGYIPEKIAASSSENAEEVAAKTTYHMPSGDKTPTIRELLNGKSIDKLDATIVSVKQELKEFFKVHSTMNAAEVAKQYNLKKQDLALLEKLSHFMSELGEAGKSMSVDEVATFFEARFP